MTKEQLLEILSQEVVVSLGVTEPGAVAMCCAAASANNKIAVEEVQLIVSPNIYKNCMSVGIPGFEEKGIQAAAALGAIGGDYTLGLESLRPVSAQHAAACKAFLENEKVKVSISDNGELLYIEAICRGKNGSGRCIVRKNHSHIALIEWDGKVIVQEDPAETQQEESAHFLLEAKLSELLRGIEELREADLELLKKGEEMNLAAAQWGLQHKPGMGAGAKLWELREKGVLPNDLSTELQIYTAAASDVRVSGSFVPIMTCAGSGNHGITALIPVAKAATWFAVSQEKKLRALALSALITVYVKNYSGKLSGMCGCGVAAATGVAAALAYLRNAGEEQIANSIKNMAGDITGMICDGAKDGCSLKLSTAVACAVRAASFAIEGLVIPNDNGIIALSAEQTMRNMGKVSAKGMTPTDAVILEIMQQDKNK